MTTDGHGKIIEWVPGKGLGILMNLLGLVLTLLALTGYAIIYSFHHPEPVSFIIGLKELGTVLLTVLIVVVCMVVHELIHGLALKTLGYQPKYGATLVGGVLPALYCTAPGVVMSKLHFTYIALLPGVVLALVPAVWIGLDLPAAGWFIAPAGILLGGAIGDVFMTIRALNSPAGTKVEDMREGLRLYLPS